MVLYSVLLLHEQLTFYQKYSLEDYLVSILAFRYDYDPNEFLPRSEYKHLDLSYRIYGWINKKQVKKIKEWRNFRNDLLYSSEEVDYDNYENRMNGIINNIEGIIEQVKEKTKL